LLYRIARDILEGLFYLHQQRVVHGDFKSDNVLLDEHTRAKISDFGSAEMVSSMGVSLCRRGTTLVYRAPELFNRSQYTSFSSDIYALGIVLWELIMRRNPHAHVPASDIERYVTSGGRDTIPSSMRSPYAMFVTACWSADMRNRPKDLRVFSHYLDRLIEALQKSTEEKKVHLKRKHASLEMAPDTFVKEKSSASFFSHPYDPLKCPSHVPCVSDDILGCRTTLI
ncbi:MAG: protein kinase domain-containing protein, partial [Legionellaceae bacterium]